MHLKDKRRGRSMFPWLQRTEKNASRTDHHSVTMYRGVCPPRMGAYKEHHPQPPARHPRGCAASSSCSPKRMGQGQPSKQFTLLKRSPKQGSFKRSGYRNPQCSSSPKSQCPKNTHFSPIAKGTNSRSLAKAKYLFESHRKHSGENRQKTAFFLIPFWTRYIISGLYITTSVSLISQSQRNHSFHVLWQMFLRMNSIDFKQEFLPHRITFPKLILKYLLANQKQAHYISEAKCEQEVCFKLKNVLVIWHFLSCTELITVQHNRCLIKEQLLVFFSSFFISLSAVKD